MPTSKRLLKKLGYWTAALLLIIGTPLYWLDYQTERRYVDPGASSCRERQYTIAGRDYIISNCGVGYVDPDNLYRLRIYSKDRELLAERYYRNVYDDYLSIGGAGQIAYWVDEKKKNIGYPNEPEDGAIQLPPTWLDWIRARLP